MNMQREFMLYSGAAICALLVDMALLSALIELGGMHYLAAASISFVTGTLVSYLLCVTFVFKFRRIGRTAPEFGAFLAIGAIGLGLNALGMAVGIELLKTHFLIAKVGTTGITFLANFVLRKLLLFTPAKALLGLQKAGQGKYE